MLRLLIVSAVLALATAEPTTYKGVKCTIPFKYHGVTYHGCTETNDNKPWCATGPENYVVGSGKWAYCCPSTSCKLDCAQLGGFKKNQHCNTCQCQLPDPCKNGKSPCGSGKCNVKAGKADCSCPENQRFDASTKSCKAVLHVLAEYKLTGYNRYQTVRAVRFQTKTFSICVRFRLNGFNRYQTLVGDWTKEWQFLFRISSNNQLGLTLRRNINSGGSNPHQDMVGVSGGNVVSHDWQTACGDWDHVTGTAYLYHNGVLVGQKKTGYSDHTLQENNHATYQVGWKGDSRNEFIAGQIDFVAFYAGIVKNIPQSKPRQQAAQVLAKYTFNGYNRYQTVRAVKFQTRSFSICVKFRLNGFNRVATLVGDWTKEWQFIFQILSNNKLALTLRRNINSGGSNPKQDMVSVTGGNVATTHNEQTACGDWDHFSGTAYMYHNGVLVGEKKTQYSDHTLQENNHGSYQVGWKGDSHNQFVDGRITALAFYGGIVKNFE